MLVDADLREARRAVECAGIATPVPLGTRGFSYVPGQSRSASDGSTQHWSSSPGSEARALLREAVDRTVLRKSRGVVSERQGRGREDRTDQEAGRALTRPGS